MIFIMKRVDLPYMQTHVCMCVCACVRMCKCICMTFFVCMHVSCLPILYVYKGEKCQHIYLVKYSYSSVIFLFLDILKWFYKIRKNEIFSVI